MKTDHANHLVDLYQKWQESPKEYNEEVLVALKRIMFSEIGKYTNKFGRLPLAHGINDYDNLISAILEDLWVNWSSKLRENTTNKEIFCFLRSRAYWKLRMVARDLKRKSVNHQAWEATINVEDTYTQDMPFATTDLEEEVVKYILNMKFPRKLNSRDIKILVQTLDVPKEEIMEALAGIGNNI